MFGCINIDSKNYTYDQFASANNLIDLGNHVTAAQNFVKDWLSGKELFEQMTSGSTGAPKRIQISRNQILASIKATASALNLESGNSALLCIDPEFIGGKMMLARSMALGLNLTLVPPSSDPTKHLPDRFHTDFSAMVPFQIEKLLDSKQGLDFLNSIRKIIIGGAKVNDRLAQGLQQVKSAVYSTYGMTETVSHIALKKLNGLDRSEVFEPLDGVETGLDARGCLKVKSVVTHDQWVITNDLVELRKDGFIWLGRIDNIINSGGIKINAEDLEDRIQSILPNIAFMITSQEDKSLGERVVMLVEQSELTSADIAALKTALPKFHCPKQFITIPTLPKTVSGKLDRQAAKNLVSSLA